MDPQPHATASHAHAGPDFKSYMTIFYVLCGLTAVSFVVNYFVTHGNLQAVTGMMMILGVAVVKAVCVGTIFMHLKADFGRLYFIIIPVTIMAIMMSIVFLPDILLAWHHEYFNYEP